MHWQAAQRSATRPSSLDKVGHAAEVAHATVAHSYADPFPPFFCSGQQVKCECVLRRRHARMWVGEAGGAYNSGAPNVTDGFVSAFWYLDNMALNAKRG